MRRGEVDAVAVLVALLSVLSDCSGVDGEEEGEGIRVQPSWMEKGHASRRTVAAGESELARALTEVNL